MRITSKAIGKAIFEATGVDHIEVFCSDGICRYFSDDEATSEFLPLYEWSAVYVCRLKHQTIEEWVEVFKYELIQNTNFFYFLNLLEVQAEQKGVQR